LRLSRLTRAKLVAECFDTLNEFLRVPLAKWKIQVANLDDEEVEEIIAFTKESDPAESASSIRYPGEQTLMNRIKSEAEGVTVNEKIWKEVLVLKGIGS